MPIIAELPRPDGRTVVRVEVPNITDIYHTALKKTLPVIFNTIDSQNRVSFDISPRMLDSLGYSEEQWRANPHTLWSSILHPEDEQLVLAEYFQPIKKNEPRIIEYRVLSKDQEIKWIRETTNLTEDDILETLLIDITEEKLLANGHRAESLLAATHALNQTINFEDLVDRLGDIIKGVIPFDSGVLQLIDENGRITDYKRWGEKPREASPIEYIDQVKTILEIVNSRKILIIPDTNDDPRWVKEGRKSIRSYVGIPIIIGEKVIGILNLNSNTPIRYEIKDLDLMIAFAEDIAIAFDRAKSFAEKDSLARQLEELSLTDTLTELPNLRFYNLTIQREIGDAIRYNRDLSIVWTDLNNFSTYNDIEGYDIGSERIRTFVNKVKEYIRKTDFWARWGGDEFILVLPHHSLDEALTAAKRIYDGINEIPPIICKVGGYSKKNDVTWNIGDIVSITASSAVVSIKEIPPPERPPDLDESKWFEFQVQYYWKSLHDLAGIKLHIAKRRGKNQIESEPWKLSQ